MIQGRYWHIFISALSHWSMKIQSMSQTRRFNEKNIKELVDVFQTHKYLKVLNFFQKQ